MGPNYISLQYAVDMPHWQMGHMWILTVHNLEKSLDLTF